VYFTSVDGYFYALNPGGGLRWRLHTGGITDSSPAIAADGTLYVAVNWSLWAITPRGEEKWERKDGCPIRASPLAASDNSVCYINSYGWLHDFGPERQVNWSVVPPYGEVSPAVSAAGTLYAPACGHEFQALWTNLRLARTSWPKFRGDAKNTGNRYVVEARH
jgi:outer membrane protein assembly factor BamB